MNTVEDKVRMALRETGEEIRPHTVPPLRLRGTRRTRLPGIPGRWGTWLAPLAAAAAVAAVVAASLAISTTFHGHNRGTGPATAPRWNGSPLGPRSALHKVPPYFVELPADTRPYVPQTATVRSTVTGRVLATVSPPQPYKVFTFVSGAADDRTFVLAAQRWWNVTSGQAGARAQNRDNTALVTFFRLTFEPATRTAHLTRLTVSAKIRATDLAGMGVSPNGTRLALDFRKSIKIINLATGATGTWTWPGGGWIGNFKPDGQIFSWSADGKTLAFQQWGGYLDSTAHVRLLDITAPGTSLTTAKVVLTFFNKEGVLTFSTPGNTLLTADGSKIVTATGFTPRQDPRLGYKNITEFSVRTGKPVLSQDKFGGAGEQGVLWASPDGSALVVSDPRGAKAQDGLRKNIFGVLAGNKFTPIPHGTHTFNQVAW
jgi:hypothetical protein